MSDPVGLSSPTRGAMSPTPGAAELEIPQEVRYEVYMGAVQNLVNAIGGFEEVPDEHGSFVTIYRPGDSVLGVLKDLKKLWRKDDADDERTVARCMYQAALMKELIGLVNEVTLRGDWGRKVALMACDLIAALTWPIDVAQELKELQDEGPVVTDYASLLRAQVEYKAQILQSDTLRCVLTLMLPCFAKERREEKDNRIISLCLHIVRNLLAIRDVHAPDTATGDKEELSHLQSTLIVQLEKLTFLELFTTMGSGADTIEFNSFNMLILDILHLLYRSIKPEELAQNQNTASSEILAKLLDQEARERALKNKGRPTRHPRFGTTISVKTAEQRVILHSQTAITTEAGKVLDAMKKRRAPNRTRKGDELLVDAILSTDAIIVLQKFSLEFLESAFNSFFSSVLKDIRMERSKVRPADTIRTLFTSTVFMDHLLRIRERRYEEMKREEKRKGLSPDDAELKNKLDEELPLHCVVEMIDITALRWVTSRMRASMDEKPIAWTELQAAIECFTQVLLLLGAMMSSTEQEDIEAAGILQNQLYYNGDILDSSLSVMGMFKDQSLGYLESVIHFAYVLLRMLEKYSKSQAYMFVRKRKPVRRKLPPPSAQVGEAPIPEEYQNEEEEGVVEEERPEYAEHKFQFTAYERRFATETITNTLIAYLERYRVFNEAEQLKRIVGLIHRQVVKAEAEGLYFRVSILALFRKILDDRVSLPKCDAARDLVSVINFVLRKFFKRLADDPFLMIEAFMPKSLGRWKAFSSYDGERDDDGIADERARIREKMGPPDLVFLKKHNLSWADQMAVVVKVLVDAGHEEWIQWVINVLEVAIAARTEVVLAVDGERALADEDSDGEVVRNFAGPSKDAQDKFVQHYLAPDTEEHTQAVATDSHLRLMLTLVNFERSEEENASDQRWFLPTSVMPDSMKASVGALRQYLADPPSLDQDPKTLMRKVRRRREKSPEYDEDGELVVPVPKARKRRQAELEVFKSAEYIQDSDDDEDADAAFFAREAQLRREMQAFAEAQGNTMRRKGTKKRKRKGGAMEPIPFSEIDINLDDDDDDVFPTGSQDSSPAGAKRIAAILDSDDDGSGFDSDLDTPPPQSRRRVRAIASDDSGEE